MVTEWTGVFVGDVVRVQKLLDDADVVRRGYRGRTARIVWKDGPWIWLEGIPHRFTVHEVVRVPKD